MAERPVIGERILRSIGGFSAVAAIVRHEHESWDGTGYPDGLVGDQIPIGSRIILACDAYHAMTSDRPTASACHTPTRSPTSSAAPASSSIRTSRRRSSRTSITSARDGCGGELTLVRGRRTSVETGGSRAAEG